MPYTYTLTREAYDTGMLLMGRAVAAFSGRQGKRPGSRRNTYGAATC